MNTHFRREICPRRHVRLNLTANKYTAYIPISEILIAEKIIAMELTMDLNTKAVHRFFDAVKPIERGFLFDNFSFVGIKKEDHIEIIQARIFRNTYTAPISASHETDLIVAARYTVAEINLSAQELIINALNGAISSPMGELRFPPGADGTFATHFDPFHPEGLAQQQRLNVLRIDGAPIAGRIDVPAIDWHLRCGDKPYHDLQDLLFSFALGHLRDQTSIEVIAFQVALVDAESYVAGAAADIGVRLAKNLDCSGVKLGYRVLNQGTTVDRGSINGNALTWEQRSDYQLGQAQIAVPPTALVECFASYNNVSQHYYYVMDKDMFQNPRRAIFETFDPGLKILKDFLSRQGRGQDARDLELGVSWLLWLLGFSTANLGSTGKTQDFADVIASTPDGHVLVVECTTGLIKSDNKLALLVQRTQLIKDRMTQSDNFYIKVIPAIVTSRSRSEVLADIEQAERLGVIVITREDLEKGPQKTLTIPNADAIFKEAEEEIRSNLEKYQTSS